MTDHKICHCRSCGAPIVWIKTQLGKNMPVDPDDIGPEDEVFDPAEHTSHFATCDYADQHRRGRS